MKEGFIGRLPTDGVELISNDESIDYYLRLLASTTVGGQSCTSRIDRLTTCTSQIVSAFGHVDKAVSVNLAVASTVWALRMFYGSVVSNGWSSYDVHFSTYPFPESTHGPTHRPGPLEWEYHEIPMLTTDPIGGVVSLEFECTTLSLSFSPESAGSEVLSVFGLSRTFQERLIGKFVISKLAAHN